MSQPPDLYGHSLNTGLELAIVAESGEVCLLERPVDAFLFSGFLGFPTAALEEGSSAFDFLGVLAGRLEALTGSGDAAGLTPLGQWLTPPFAPHRVEAQVFRVDLAGKPELREGRWVAPAEALRAWHEGGLLIEPPVLAFLRSLCHEEIPFELDEDVLEVRPGLWMMPLRTPTLPPATHTNCYLFGQETLLIIDPASPYHDEQERLEAALDRLAARGHRPGAVLLTHHHHDHVAGAMRMRERYGIPIFGHPETVRLLDERVEMTGPLEDLTTAGVREGRVDIAAAITTLEGFDPGATALVSLYTPGHAWGHLCFLEPRSMSVVTGDMVAGWGSIGVIPPEGDMALYLGSLERLKGLNPSLLLPAHGPPIGGAMRKLDEYIEHRLSRERQVVAGLEAGPATAAGLVDRIYVGLPEMLKWAAQASIQAHLDKLEREGRVASIEHGSYRLA